MRGYSVPVCEIDLRVGGAWRFVNRGPMGDVAFLRVYREIAAPDRVVFTEIYEPFPGRRIGRDRGLDRRERQDAPHATCLYPSLDVRDMVLKQRDGEGRRLSYDRLEDVVRELQQS